MHPALLSFLLATAGSPQTGCQCDPGSFPASGQIQTPAEFYQEKLTEAYNAAASALANIINGR